MQYSANISFKGAALSSKGGLLQGISYGNTAITPRNFSASMSQVKAQYDAAAGQLTGKRTHSPLVIVKETDSASPKLYQAMCTNEALHSVVIDVVGRPKTGAGEVIVSKITLTNAQISKVNRYSPRLVPHNTGSVRNAVISTSELEEVSFVFQKIIYTNLMGATTATDDWITP